MAKTKMARHEALATLAAFETGYIEVGNPELIEAATMLGKKAQILKVPSFANPKSKTNPKGAELTFRKVVSGKGD